METLASVLTAQCSLWRKIPVPGTLVLTHEKLCFVPRLAGAQVELAIDEIDGLCRESTFSSHWLVASGASGDPLHFGYFSNGVEDVDAFLAAFNKLRDAKVEQNLRSAEKLSLPNSDQMAAIMQHESSGASNLPAGEILMGKFVCTLFYDKRYHKGKIFLFPNFLSFLAENHNLRCVIPYVNLAFIVPSATLYIFSNAINLITNRKSFFLVSSQRDALLERLTLRWRESKRSNIDPMPSISHRANEKPTASNSNRMQNALIEKYLDSHVERNILVRTRQLSMLCQNGIPDGLRCHLWQLCSGALYKRMLEGDDYYIRLVEQTRSVSNNTTDDIEKDVKRSFPEHPLFKTEPGITSLRNVLRAYSFRNPRVGYTQGMNFIAAHLLAFCSESEAFFLLATIIEDLNQGVYRRSLIGAIVNQQIFGKVLENHLPRLHKHFKSCDFDIAMVSTSWWLTMFVGVLSYDTCMVVWDCVFVDSNAVLLKVALALCKLNEERLYNAREAHEFITIFNETTKSFSAVQLFQSVSTVVGIGDFLELKRRQFLIEESKKMSDTSRRRELEHLSKKKFQLTYYELENIYDYCQSFGGGGGIEFLSFQRILPHFITGLDLDMMLRLFNHYVDPKEETISVENVCILVNLVLKGSLETQWRFLWGIFSSSPDSMNAKDFRAFITCIGTIRYAYRSLFGPYFLVPDAVIAAFLRSLCGEDEVVYQEETYVACVVNERLSVYFERYKKSL